jgi:hypothetical protein
MRKYDIPGDISPFQSQPGVMREILEDYGDKMSAEDVAKLEQYAAPPGSLYNVDLLVDESELLDWDIPLKDQPESVQNAMKEIWSEGTGLEALTDDEFYSVMSNIDRNGVFYPEDQMEEFGYVMTKDEIIDSWREFDPDMLEETQEYLAEPLDMNMTGGSLHRQLVAKKGGGDVNSNEASAEISEELKKRGVPGIRYLDGDSRPTDINDTALRRIYSQSGSVDEAVNTMMQRYRGLSDSEASQLRQTFTDRLNNQSNNYVIFDDNLVEIKTRNGEPVAPQQRAEQIELMRGDSVEQVAEQELTGKPIPATDRAPAAEFSTVDSATPVEQTFTDLNFDERFTPRRRKPEKGGGLTGPEAKRLGSFGAQIEPRRLDIPEQSIVDLEGRPFITSMSDRTAAGGMLTRVGDTDLEMPVDLRGGQDYMFDEPNAGQVWASDPRQLSAPAGGMQNVGRVDTQRPIVDRSGHPTYAAGLPGEGLGVLREDVAAYQLLPQETLLRGITDPRSPSAEDLRSLQMKPFSGIITEDIIRSIVEPK